MITIYMHGESTQQGIYENNIFEADIGLGASLHVYGGVPEYHIFRNNVIIGGGSWGVLLDGANSVVANNTMYMGGGAGSSRGVNMQNAFSANNVIKNNIFVDPGYAALIFEGAPANNIIQNNIVYDGSFSSGTCDSCTITNNYQNTNPLFLQYPPTTWTDMRLQSGSPAIGTGQNLGASYQNGLSPDKTTLPLETLNQNNYGAWEIGAFIFTGVGL